MIPLRIIDFAWTPYGYLFTLTEDATTNKVWSVLLDAYQALSLLQQPGIRVDTSTKIFSVW